MCRLYAFRATHPTRVECELIEAQNSLIRQSEGDARGLVNDDGWGIGWVTDDGTDCRREVGPAAESADYRRRAAQVRARTVLAHVRRATVGEPSLDNTHPFRADASMLVHNGHLGDFGRLRERFLDAMDAEHAEAIRGSTDSEHLFRLLLSRWSSSPRGSTSVPDPRRLLRETLREVESWNRESGSGEEVAANVFWTLGQAVYGSRLGRSLWYVERDGPHLCPVCGEYHPADLPGDAEYRAVVIASERITDEKWTAVPERSVLRVSDEVELEVRPMDGSGGAS